jgi:hypothetical protein
MEHDKEPDTLLPVPSNSGASSPPPPQRFLLRFRIFQWLVRHPKFVQGGGLLMTLPLIWAAIQVELDGAVKTAALFFLAAWTLFALTFYFSNWWDGHRWRVVSATIIAGICLRFLWWAYLPTPPQAELQPAPTPAQELHGILIPAEEPTPPHRCSEVPEDAVIAFLGGYASVSVAKTVPIQLGSRPLITIDKSEGGIELSTRIISKDNQVVAQIMRNELHTNPSNYFSLDKSKDWHTMAIRDKDGNEVFYAHFYNRNALRIRGRFYMPNCGRVVVMTDNELKGENWSVSGAGCVTGFRSHMYVPCS